MKPLTPCCQNSSVECTNYFSVFVSFLLVNRDRNETVNVWIGQHIRIENVIKIDTGVRSGFRISPQDNRISIAERIAKFVVVFEHYTSYLTFPLKCHVRQLLHSFKYLLQTSVHIHNDLCARSNPEPIMGGLIVD